MLEKEILQIEVSKHNQWHEIDKENFLLLNPFSGALDVVDKELVELLWYVQAHSQLPAELDQNNEIISMLFRRGYLLTSPDEERKRARALEKRIAPALRIPGFLLIPSYDCNFRCPYCYEQSLRTKTKEFLDKILSEEQVDASFRAVEEMLEQCMSSPEAMMAKQNMPSPEGASKQPIEVTLYGGEPFLPRN
ncbi:MAG: hypothetical protein ACFFBD_06495, partial [Candidatus Hodarchaeota archaeon]